jgi:hypothetical protein
MPRYISLSLRASAGLALAVVVLSCVSSTKVPPGKATGGSAGTQSGATGASAGAQSGSGGQAGSAPQGGGSGGSQSGASVGRAGGQAGAGAGSGGTPAPPRDAAVGTDGSGIGVPTCDGTGVNTDPSCNSTLAKKNAPCTVDCCIPCGIDALGARVCTCAPATGYSQCICNAPPGWPVPLHGGACNPQGLSTSKTNTPVGMFSVRGQACSTQWTVCFTSDGIAAANLGCICLADPATGALTMHCGTVNNWFTYDPGVTTTY